MSDAVYKQYCKEFEQACLNALGNLNNHVAHHELFKILTPLWTLLGTATHESIAINPTKELLLSHLSAMGDAEKFLAVSSDKRFERLYSNELRDASKAIAFTSYFDELVSDSVSLINAFAIYDYRGVVIALRCMLEDLYRHLYYKDNRENFVRVHELGESEFSLELAPKDFRKHLSKASYLRPLGEMNWSFQVRGKTFHGHHALNDALYAASSAYAHGASPNVLNQFSSNLDRAYSQIKATETTDLVRRFVELAISYLLFAHKEYFARFNEADKRVVLSAFTKIRRIELRRKISV